MRRLAHLWPEDASQSGFAFIEVMVASAILLMATVATGAQLGTQFLSISTSADQQVASTLVDQAMEEVRALPYTYVTTGLSLTDLQSESPADPNIHIVGSTCYTNNTAIWKTQEVIPCAAPASGTQAPFVPHISTDTVSGIRFSIAAYPSIDAADTGSGSTVYRVTIIVSWGSTHAGPTQLVSQTLVYSASSGCLTQTNHPFAAPCQPFLYSSAAAGAGYINIIPDASTSNPPVNGDPFTQVELTLPTSSSNIQIEQVSTATGQEQTSGGIIETGPTQGVGGASASVSDDNDPGTIHGSSSSGSVSQNSGTTELPTSPTAGQNWISVQPGSTDSGSLAGTVAANGSPACYDLLGLSQTMGLPCGSGSISQSGSAAAVNLGLYAGSASLGTAPLGTVAAQPATYPDKTFVGRYTTSGGSYCGSTSGDGCVHSGAQEAVGTVEIGGLPSQFLTDHASPASWGAGTGVCPSGSGNNNYVLAVVNYSAGVTSESGVSPGSPAASVPIAGSGSTPTLCYWSGSGYTALPMTWGASSPSAASPSTVSVTDSSIATGAVTVTITPTIQLVPDTTSSSTPTGCSTVCTGQATVPSLVQVNLLYVVSQGGSDLADFDLQLSLGQVEAKTSYQAAP